MARTLPPLTWFRAFEAAARHLNFTAAASELGLTQSAISQQVRSLEVRLGVSLFVRKPRGLALTDDGRKLLPPVGSAMQMLSSAAEVFDRGERGGSLTIATSVSVAQWIIAPNLPQLLAQQPGLRIRLLSTIWPDDFNASIADVEIRFGSKKQVGAGARRLRPDRLIAVAAPKAAVSLEKGPLIEAVGTAQGWRDWAAASKATLPDDTTIQVDSYGLALDMARCGAGVALTSSLLAADPLAKGGVVQVNPVAIEGEDGYFIATNPKSSLAQSFEAWLLTSLISTGN